MKHKDLVTVMEAEDLQERLLRFAEVMESQCPSHEVCDVYPDVYTCIKRGRLEPSP